jgi:hypothetical protein
MVVLGLLLACGAEAQFMTKLEPVTIGEFERYAAGIEQALSQRWQGQSAFLPIDDDAAERAQVMQGDLVIRPASAQVPVAITNGLIHDWVGAVFMPNTTIERVLGVLQNFDQHARIYPSIMQSRLVSRNGNDLVGYWRLHSREGFITAVVDVEQEAHYKQVAPGKWVCRGYAKNIREVEDAGTSREKKLPPGEGHGFLWRLYVYWSLETTDHGVLAECRSLSLSRDIPSGLDWAIQPFVRSLPRDSLRWTLERTRVAATE